MWATSAGDTAKRPTNNDAYSIASGMIGQDFATGKPLGYRALMNLGYRRAHPPRNMDLELERVVQQFIDLSNPGRYQRVGSSRQRGERRRDFPRQSSFDLCS